MHHLEGNAVPAGYCHTNAHCAYGVNNYLNINHTKYLAQLCGRFLRFGKFLPKTCESCGATYQRNYETFCAL